VTPAFLEEERRRATELATTADCRDGVCVSCGVCGAGVEMEILV
jgi:succinate dehydrogenase/fumarate reductase-like Fe-S protein